MSLLMGSLAGARLLCPTATVAANNGLSALSIRLVGNRTRLYGNEEGHGDKNEVRKVRWQRKHLIRATGGRFRHSRGLPPDPFASYGLATRPDWSHAADGAPGTLTPKQADAVVIMREMVEDVKKALDHVNYKV